MIVLLYVKISDYVVDWNHVQHVPIFFLKFLFLNVQQRIELYLFCVEINTNIRISKIFIS